MSAAYFFDFKTNPKVKALFAGPPAWLFLSSLCFGATMCISCSSMKENVATSEYQLKAQELLGDDLSFVFNKDSSMVLCQKVQVSDDLPNPRAVHYAVLSLVDSRLVHKAHMANGSVQWFDGESLLVRNRKSYPQGTQQQAYILNVINKSKKQYNSLNPSQEE